MSCATPSSASAALAHGRRPRTEAQRPVADIGGGPGRYALWLASLGYQVEHRDLMPLHVEQLAADAAEVPGIHTAVGDVRDLDLPDAAVDAVVLLGPHQASQTHRA
jgi:SAM-dependent methyltransferase